MAVITRFAPSPTNNNPSISDRGLHIGGLRTAFYNYIWAKKNNSPCILRIEDTDIERSNDDCLRCIIEDLEWAGIHFDAGFKIENDQIVEYNNTNIDLGPLKQSNRKEIYNKYVDLLFREKKAYHHEGAIFFSMPKEDVIVNDEILGKLILPKSDCQDFPIIKSSGMPNFIWAMTIDDRCMGITDIIRGSEHVNTAYRQVALQKALRLPSPKFAHIPLIMNQDGSKMSKRQTTDQVNVADFRRDGYLPWPLLNFISLLGWSPGNNIEEFDLNFMLEKFNIRDIGKANARFDYKKLEKFNANYLNRMDQEKFEDELSKYGSIFYPKQTRTKELSSLYYKRTKTLKEPFENSQFLTNDRLSINLEEADKILNNGGIEILEEIKNHLENIETWNHESILKTIENFTKEKNLSMNKVCQPIRLAVTCRTVSPPIDLTLEIVGKSVTLIRIHNLLNMNELLSNPA